jgi:hypothetical protein
MSFRIRGLSPDAFAPLFVLDEAQLAERHIQSVVADEPHSAPCRISLEDAEPGERLLLLSHEHQPGPSPYRQSGPIYVREQAREAFDGVDQIPAAIARRTISARAYDRQAMMLEGEVIAGAELPGLLEAWLARPEVDVVHLHYARRGCYAARVERV